MKKVWHDTAWDDYLYWLEQDKKILRKINDLVRDIERHPFEGLGKPEPLKGEYSGLWSRRIDEKTGLFILSETQCWKLCSAEDITKQT